MRCVVLLSGGLDSLVAAAEARGEHDLQMALTCDYGQRAAAREMAAARAQARWLGCAHQVICLPWLGALGGSALTDSSTSLPAPAPEALDNPQAAAQAAAAVWVPNRNGVLVNVAAAWAERLGAEAVVCGFNAEEAAAFADNSPQFIAAVEQLWQLSTRNGLRLLAPTVEWDKSAIVARGLELQAPLRLVWSCYRGGEQPCWRCESCLRLRRALERNGAWEQYLNHAGSDAL